MKLRTDALTLIFLSQIEWGLRWCHPQTAKDRHTKKKWWRGEEPTFEENCAGWENKRVGAQSSQHTLEHKMENIHHKIRTLQIWNKDRFQNVLFTGVLIQLKILLTKGNEFKYKPHRRSTNQTSKACWQETSSSKVCNQTRPYEQPQIAQVRKVNRTKKSTR